MLATSDLPGGVVNVLSGKAAEVAPHLAAHADVNGLDLGGVADAALAASLEAAAAETLKVVRRPGKTGTSLDLLRQWTEYKTVWHPAGMAAAAGGGYYSRSMGPCTAVPIYGSQASQGWQGPIGIFHSE